MPKIKKHNIVMLMFCLIAAILLEMIFACFKGAAINYKLYNPVSLYSSPVFEHTMSGYEENGNKFVPLNNDPMLVFSSLNTPIESIYVTFSEPLKEETSFQLFYSTEKFGFSEEHSLKKMLYEGVTEIALDIPGIDCRGLRFDINGEFSIADIQLSERDFEQDVVFENINFNFLRVIVFLIGILLVSILLYHFLIKPSAACILTRCEFLYCLGMFAFYFLWAVSKEFNYAPDEYMRYEVSHFFYENNRLPAYEETINAYWGFSYAHNPTMLCNVLGYIPMKIASLFSTDGRVLLIAARMVSVLCGTGVVLFSILTAKKLFNEYTKWIYIVFISCIPQFIFLTTYVNNDIVALFGASMIFYSWTASLRSSWNYKLLTLLSLGISICATSYYNSYGWILCSIIFYIVSYFMKSGYSARDFIKRSSFVCGIVIILSSYLFVRHYVLYGDLLGFNIIDHYNELYGQNAGRQTLREQGISIYTMLFNMGWIKTTYRSFIETFGYMSVYAENHVYYIYTAVFIIGFIFAAIMLIRAFAKKMPSINKINSLYILCLLITIAIPAFLNVWHSYNSDYQPQGRYSYPGIFGISYIVVCGFSFILEKLKKKEYRFLCTGVFSAVLITIAVSEYFVTYLPY